MSDKYKDFAVKEDEQPPQDNGLRRRARGHSVERVSSVERILWLYLRGQSFMLSTVVLSLLAGSLIWLLMHWGTRESPMDWNNLFYFWLLSAFVGVCGLIWDFVCQKKYLISLWHLHKRSDWLPLRKPVTAEQKLVTDVMAKLHHDYEEKLDGYRRQRKLHRYFVYQWVHMMKTPLSVIDLTVQHANHMDKLSGKELRSFMDSLREETDRMTRGLEQMLYTARLEEFALDLHPRRVALHEVARQVINQHKRLMIAAHVYPRLSGEGWAKTDLKWLQFLLGQLIGNAVKYSRPKLGDKQLQVRINNQDDGHAWIEISDQGIGIPAEDLPRVFDPFFTGENGHSTEESTGMGLYLCREVARKLGLRLDLHSEQGSGTTVVIYFESDTI